MKFDHDCGHFKGFESSSRCGVCKVHGEERLCRHQPVDEILKVINLMTGKSYPVGSILSSIKKLRAADFEPLIAYLAKFFFHNATCFFSYSLCKIFSRDTPTKDAEFRRR